MCAAPTRRSLAQVGGSDQLGREHQLHRGPVVGEPRDDRGAPAFLDEEAPEISGAHPDAVPGWDAADGEQRDHVVLETADRRRVLAPMSVDQPVGARAASNVGASRTG